MRRSTATLSLIAATIFASAAAADEGAELESARGLWQDAQSGNYRYSFQKYCDCYRGEPPTTVVTVGDGQIRDVFHLHSDSDRQVPAREGSFDLYWTVEDLFAKLETAYSRNATVRVEYHPNLGYPVSLYIDYDPAFAGDETDLRLREFERLQ